MKTKVWRRTRNEPCPLCSFSLPRRSFDAQGHLYTTKKGRAVGASRVPLQQLQSLTAEETTVRFVRLAFVCDEASTQTGNGQIPRESWKQRVERKRERWPLQVITAPRRRPPETRHPVPHLYARMQGSSVTANRGSVICLVDNQGRQRERKHQCREARVARLFHSAFLLTLPAVVSPPRLMISRIPRVGGGLQRGRR